MILDSVQCDATGPSRRRGDVVGERSEGIQDPTFGGEGRSPSPADPRGARNASLVQQARAGGAAGESAWRALVQDNAAAAWKAIWTVSLAPDGRADAFQSTWLRAVERLDQLREPTRFHAWVMTIARHEALAIARRSRLQEHAVETDVPAADEVDSRRLEQLEQRRLLGAALRRLSPECQALVGLLTADPPVTYAEIEQLMGWRPGGTAIRRARCIARLVATPEIGRYLHSLEPGAEEWT